MNNSIFQTILFNKKKEKTTTQQNEMETNNNIDDDAIFSPRIEKIPRSLTVDDVLHMNNNMKDNHPPKEIKLIGKKQKPEMKNSINHGMGTTITLKDIKMRLGGENEVKLTRRFSVSDIFATKKFSSSPVVKIIDDNDNKQCGDETPSTLSSSSPSSSPESLENKKNVYSELNNKSSYKNLQYFFHTPYSYYDSFITMNNMRCKIFSNKNPNAP